VYQLFNIPKDSFVNTIWLPTITAELEPNTLMDMGFDGGDELIDGANLSLPFDQEYAPYYILTHSDVITVKLSKDLVNYHGIWIVEFVEFHLVTGEYFR